MLVTYEEAKARLDLTSCWSMAPNPNGTAVPQRGGVFKSPLRADNKGKSFSVTSDLRFFKDHAHEEHKGGVYKFIALCRPEWDKSQIVRCMIELAGGDPDARDPNAPKRKKKDYTAEKEKARDAAHSRRQRENLSIKPVDKDRLRVMPPKVRKSWQHCQERARTMDFYNQLAEERGWQWEWVEDLVLLDKLGACPKGQPVFAVEVAKGGGEYDLLGYHSRWLPKHGGKAWSYRPCMKWDKQEIAAAPFIMGRVESPLWVVCEGQWDAITAYALLGGFYEQMTVEACCFGIRGASGVDVWLDVYSKLLRKHRPKILLIPDADEAADGWKKKNTDADHSGKWKLNRRIKRIFAIDVQVLKFTRTETCKDLNDFYKHGGLKEDHLLNIVTALLPDE